MTLNSQVNKMRRASRNRLFKTGAAVAAVGAGAAAITTSAKRQANKVNKPKGKGKGKGYDKEVHFEDDAIRKQFAYWMGYNGGPSYMIKVQGMTWGDIVKKFKSEHKGKQYEMRLYAKNPTSKEYAEDMDDTLNYAVGRAAALKRLAKTAGKKASRAIGDAGGVEGLAAGGVGAYLGHKALTGRKDKIMGEIKFSSPQVKSKFKAWLDKTKNPFRTKERAVAAFIKENPEYKGKLSYTENIGESYVFNSTYTEQEPLDNSVEDMLSYNGEMPKTARYAAMIYAEMEKKAPPIL